MEQAWPAPAKLEYGAHGWAELAAEARGDPRRTGWAVEAVGLVMLLTVLVTLLTPKPKTGFRAESAAVLVVVPQAAAEGTLTLAGPGNRGVFVLVPEVVV